MTPWLSLLLRACPGPVEELRLVLHPQAEQLRDLGVTFSRILLDELGRGGLDGVRRVWVGESGGGGVEGGAISRELRGVLEARGVEVLEGWEEGRVKGMGG